MRTPKEIIIDKFKKSKFVLDDPIPLDEEIKEFIYELRGSSHIITTNSCAGHDKDTLHPYLAFVADEYGWDCFWQILLPQISLNVMVSTEIVNEFEKRAIVVRCHYSEKKLFWDTVKPLFIGAFCT